MPQVRASRVMVVVCTEFFGSHRWPQAPQHRSYLREQHWHPFRVRIEVLVQHEEREVELHDLRMQLDRCIVELQHSSSAWSCETWALRIGGWLFDLGLQVASCEVWEDHAHGARVEFQCGG